MHWHCNHDMCILRDIAQQQTKTEEMAIEKMGEGVNAFAQRRLSTAENSPEKADQEEPKRVKRWEGRNSDSIACKNKASRQGQRGQL
jgi:hypothetical protein